MSKKQDTKLPKDHIQAIVNIGGQGTGFEVPPFIWTKISQS